MRGACARTDDKLKMTPHTAAKHSILRCYLDCWFPILGHAGSVAYVDGFAGPGRYPTGEEGSPIIALNAARDKIEHLKSGAQFWFVENDPDAATTLQGEIGRIRANLPGALLACPRAPSGIPARLNRSMPLCVATCSVSPFQAIPYGRADGLAHSESVVASVPCPAGSPIGSPVEPL